MTVEVSKTIDRLRASADAAVVKSAAAAVRGHHGDAQFHAGRQAGLLTAINALLDAEHAEAQERDEQLEQNIRDEMLGVEALRAGVIGYGEFATETGALDQASGTVYSDADGGL